MPRHCRWLPRCSPLGTAADIHQPMPTFSAISTNMESGFGVGAVLPHKRSNRIKIFSSYLSASYPQIVYGCAIVAMSHRSVRISRPTTGRDCSSRGGRRLARDSDLFSFSNRSLTASDGEGSSSSSISARKVISSASGKFSGTEIRGTQLEIGFRIEWDLNLRLFQHFERSLVFPRFN